MRLRRLTGSGRGGRGGGGRNDIVRERQEAAGGGDGGAVESDDGGDDDSHSGDESAIIPPVNDLDDDSSSGSEEDGSDIELPSGFLTFLSTQQSRFDDELSAVAQRLRGEDQRSSAAPPLLQISFVREYVRDEGAVQIARALEDGCASFHNEGNNGSAGTGAPLPQSRPRQCPSHYIREIVFSRCHIGDRGACALARAISNSCTPSLQMLDLSSNNITGVGTTCLADCLVTRESTHGRGFGMETLVLSSNPIGVAGASALANALGGHRSESGSEVGACCLQKLHVSGCKLNDEDAIALGNALLPHGSAYSGISGDWDDGINLPSLPKTNKLTLLNLHSNCITTRGMEHLYFVIMALGPGHDAREGADLDSLQSLYCKSSHAVDLGVIVDYGTRDYNYGNFFDQEEDELLLADVREYEMSGTEPKVAIGELKALLMSKLSLMHQIMDALHVNRQCIVALKKESASAATPTGNVPGDLTEKRRCILRAAARKKITRAIEQKLHPCSPTLPRRQDEYGKYLEDDFLGVSSNLHHSSPTSATIGKLFSGLEPSVFPRILSWISRGFRRHDGWAILFDILRENPDVCGFHSANIGKRLMGP